MVWLMTTCVHKNETCLNCWLAVSAGLQSFYLMGVICSKGASVIETSNGFRSSQFTAKITS